jgi:hypothetical protein
MQYHLRTLLIVLAVGPALLAGMWFGVVVSVLYVREIHVRSEQTQEIQPAASPDEN